MIHYLLVAVLGVVIPPHKIGVAAWCNVDKVTNTIECNYNTQAECEAYLQSDETCEKNDGKK